MNGASVFTLGKFTVRVGIRPDNPYFPCYRVFVGERLIGKSFSRPDLGCAQWLERQTREERVVYAAQSHSTHAGLERRRKPGPGGPGRPRKYAYGPG